MPVWWIIAAAVLVVLVGIIGFRLHAFLTLLAASLLVAVLSAGPAVDQYAEFKVAQGKMSVADADALRAASPVARVTGALGRTTGKIGVLIALASVIGGVMMESGAAARVVDSMLRLTGPRRAPEALAAGSFFLGIPVFFDTVFYLMVPLARSTFTRTGRNYTLLVLSILAGGSLAHSLIPPTPGPLAIADTLDVDVATMMFAGLGIGAISSIFSLIAARVIDRFNDVPMRPIEGMDDAGKPSTNPSDLSPAEENDPSREDSPNEPSNPPAQVPWEPRNASAQVAREPRNASEREDSDPGLDRTGLPPLWISILPIAVPVFLLSFGSVLEVAGWLPDPSPVAATVRLLCEKNVALAIGCLVSLGLFRYLDAIKRKTLITRSISSAGGIILITAAGGALGAVLAQAGVEQAVGRLASEVSGLWILPLAFAVTASIRTLQGSATVAMITSAGILQGLADPTSLGFHPVYLAMAIGAGSKPVSWMTDSAFWVITRMSGMTEAEGLKTISPMSTAMGLSALGVTLVAAALFPST